MQLTKVTISIAWQWSVQNKENEYPIWHVVKSLVPLNWFSQGFFPHMISRIELAYCNKVIALLDAHQSEIKRVS